MAAIRLEWAQFGAFDYFNIYRSLSVIDTSNLPTPTSVKLREMYYVDTDVIDGATYHYRVGVVANSIEKISDEISVIASSTDQYFPLVDSLIFADATNFPSISIVDSSTNSRNITIEGDTKIVSPSVAAPKFSEGTIAFDGSYDRLSLACTQLLLSDFTAEIWIESIAGGIANGRLFMIGSQDTQGALLFCKYPNNPAAGINLILRDGGAFPAPISTGPTTLTGDMQHICLMRKSGIFYIFSDGVLVGSSSAYTSFSLTGTILYLGSGSNISDGTAAYWDSWRLTKVARYDTSGFTPPNIKFIAK